VTGCSQAARCVWESIKSYFGKSGASE
jgi:hypothetical protein